MEEKQCVKWKHFLLFECFKNNKKTRQLTKYCAKCLDYCNKLSQQTKCEYGRQRSYCKACGGSQIREHSKIKKVCLFCSGSQICEHNNIKSYCLFCGGIQICEQKGQRSKCLSCGGGGICEHNRRRSTCKGCGRGKICEHNKQRSRCPTCDPLGHLADVVRSRVYATLKNDKEMSSTEYLGCNIKTFKQHIEHQFTEGMSWENYGEWHINHKIPLKYNKPSLEEVVQRLH